MTKPKAKKTGSKAKARPATAYPKASPLLGPLDPGRLLTINEAAARLTVSLKTLRRLIAAGSLPVVRIGGLVRIRPEDLTNFIAQNVG